MSNHITQTAKHTLIYSIGNTSVKLIGLLLLPLYTSKLTVSDYGKLGLLEVTAQFMIVVFGFNIYSAMIRWYSEQKSEIDKKKIVFSSFFSLFFLLFLVNAVLIPLRSHFAQLYFNDLHYAPVFFLLFISVSFEILNNITLSLFRVQEKSGRFITFMITKLVIVLGLNIYFIAFAGLGVKGIFLSAAIGNSLMFVISIPILLANSSFSIRWKVLKEMFHYSFPLVFSSISMMLLSMGDRFFIKYYLNDAEVGIYSLAYKIAGVLNMILIQSFALSFLPIAYKMIHHEKAEEFYQKILHYFSVILVLFAFLLSLFAREMLEVFARNSDYWAASVFVPLLALAFVFKGIQYIFSLGLHYVKKTKYNAYIVMSGVILNFGLNIFLIPKIGIWGAAITTIFSSLFITILYYLIAQKKFYIAYQLKKLILVILLPVTLYFSIFFINESLSFCNRLLIKLVLSFVLISIFNYMKFIKIDVVVIKKIIKRIIKLK
jgi:O-antigen/teichoic acid export membrane protein